MSDFDFIVHSDFRDFYDAAFDWRGTFHVGQCWNRATRTSWTRRQDFRHMEEASLHVVKHGEKDCFDPDEQVVIYEDERAHCGEGKILGTARDMKPGQLASRLAQGSRAFGISYRALGVGSRTFWLRYESSSDWRSNFGEVEITEAEPWEGFSSGSIRRALACLQSIRRTPLVAVDFLDTGKTWLEAVDLNTAPGMTGTPAQKALSGSEVVRLLKERWAEITPWMGS